MRSNAHSIAGLALASIAAALLLPGWEAKVRASVYGDLIAAQTADSLREGERQLALSRYQQQIAPRRPWSGFLLLDYEGLEREQSSRENGYKDHIPGFTAGVNHQLSSRLRIGGFFALKWNSRRFNKVPVDSRYNPKDVGKQDTRDLSFTVNGTYTWPEISILASLAGERAYGLAETALLQASLGYGHIDIAAKRSGEGLVGTARGDTSGGRITAALGGRYDLSFPFTLGLIGKSLALGFEGSANYVDTWMDGYREVGEPADKMKLLIVRGQDASVVNLDGGLRTSYLFDFAWGRFIPEVRFDYQYRDVDRTNVAIVEFQQGPPQQFAKDPPDRQVIVLGSIVRLVFPSTGLDLWFQYDRTFEERYIERQAFRLGAQLRF